MANYNEYLEFNEEKDKERQIELLSKIHIEKDLIEDIKSINNKKLLVFAEPYCPDCRVLVAIIERIRALNSVNIDIEYLSRKDNMMKLKMFTEEMKIPAVFLIDGIKIKMLMEEYPKYLKDKIDITEYRQGKYNKELITFIVNALKEN